MPVSYLVPGNNDMTVFILFSTTQVEGFLTQLYHGKPKACDLARFLGRMKEEGEEQDNARFSLDDIRSTMDRLQKEVISTCRCVDTVRTSSSQ